MMKQTFLRQQSNAEKGKFWLDIRRKNVHSDGSRIVEQAPRVVVESSSLEILKTQLNSTLSSQMELVLLWEEHWTRQPPKVLSSLN